MTSQSPAAEEGPPLKDRQTEEIVRLFQDRLSSRTGGPSDFSDKGSIALLAAQSEHLTRIGLEAIRQAIDDSSDYVDATHVERAVENLSREAARVDWLQWAGGVLLGVAIPLLIQFGKYAPGKAPTALVYWLLITFSSGLAATLVALALTITVRRRR